MLNEERIILMTRMASFEKGEGKENVKIGNYFRSDYITVQLLKAIISGAVAFVILFGLYVCYHFEELMQDLYQMDLIAFVQNIIFYFIALVAGYGVLTYLVSSWRYNKARKSLKCYYHNLKKLNSLYNDMQ